MNEFRFNSKGTDALYLANVNTFFSALFGLAIFRNGWPEEKLGSQRVLQKYIDWFRQVYVGGLTGDRVYIAARRAARQDLDLRIRKILHYLTAMADTDDVDALLNTDVVMRTNGKRTRNSAKPVVAQ